MNRRQPQAVEPSAEPSQPAAPPRPPAREAKVFNSGFTFAERKAAREAREAAEGTPRRRLASYGTRRQWLEPAGRTGKGRMIEVEMLVDVATGEAFQRMVPYGTLEPIGLGPTGGETKVEPLGTINPSGGSGLFPPARADAVTPINAAIS